MTLPGDYHRHLFEDVFHFVVILENISGRKPGLRDALVEVRYGSGGRGDGFELTCGGALPEYFFLRSVFAVWIISVDLQWNAVGDVVVYLLNPARVVGFLGSN